MYAIVDIETTGGKPFHQRIIEIAIIIHDGLQVVSSFQTLVNPQVSIPYYITGLTGITDEMVSTAPTFEEIADQILRLTEEKVFVAHNVNFDYSFLQTSFERMGIAFERAHLCTIRLARKIFPNLKKYNLGAICQHLGIPIQNRHRAAGDALATAFLFSALIAHDRNQEIQKQLRESVQRFYFPPAISPDFFETFPQTPGIYYFHDKAGNIIYIGKANSLKVRIKQHFSKGSHTQQNPLMVSEIESISFEQTGNELLALLRECEEIQKHLPKYNIALKHNKKGYGIFQYQDRAGYKRLSISKINQQAVEPIAYFEMEEDARKFLRKLHEQYHLCPKMIGLHLLPTACYEYEKNNCWGACCEKESSYSFNVRLEKALEEILSSTRESYLLQTRGRYPEEHCWIWIHEGIYKGFCFTEKTIQVSSWQDILSLISPKPYSAQANAIVQMYIRTNASHLQKFML